MPRVKATCPRCHRRLRGATTDMIGDVGVCPKCKYEFEIRDDQPRNKGHRWIYRATTLHSRGFGLKIVITTPPFEIEWPRACAVCAGPIDKDAPANYMLSLPESWGTESIELYCCQRCSRRIGIYQRLGMAGYGLAGITFLLAIIRQPKTELEWLGAGGLFWFGILVGWVGARKDKIGIESGSLETGGFIVQFRHRRFARMFFDLNRKKVDSIAASQDSGNGSDVKNVN